MDELVGFLNQHGFSGINSVLIVALFFILRGRFLEMEEKVKALWDWHLVQQGKDQADTSYKGDDV